MELAKDARSKLSWPLTVALLFSLTMFAACSNSGGPNESSPTELPVAELGSRWATGEAASISALVESSGWAFTGEVVALDHQTSIDLVPDDPEATPPAPVPGKPLPANDGPPPLPVSIWQVRVTDVLLGDFSVGDTVLVRQMGGIHEQSDGSLIRVQLDGDELMAGGERYLFFISPPGADGQVLTSPLKRFHVLEDGSYEALTEFAALGAMTELQSLSAPQAHDAIQAAAQ